MKLTSALTVLLAGSAVAVTKTKTLTKTLTTTLPASTVTVTPKHKTVTNHKTVTSTSTIISTSTSVVTSTAVASSTNVVTSTAVVSSTNVITSTEVDTNTVTATETDTTTLTSTTTVTPSPTYSAFIGQGNLVVFAEGSKFGHVSKYGGWYTSSTPATYTGTSVSQDNSFFTLTTSQGPCTVLGSGALNCTAGNTGSTFGQTMDGNLTYSGSDIFGADSGPTSSAPGTVIYNMDDQFTLNIRWFDTTNSKIRRFR